MQLLSLDSGTERRRHSYASPEAPRPQVATFTPTFQVRVGDIPGAISSSPTAPFCAWEGESAFPGVSLLGPGWTRQENCPQSLHPWHCCAALSELPVLPHPSPQDSQLQRPPFLPCLPQVVAGFSFAARSPQEVTLQAGQPVQVLEPHDKKGSTEWSLVEVNGQRGYVPSSYLVTVPVQDPVGWSLPV